MNPERDVARTYWSGKDCPTVLHHKKNGWEDFVHVVAQKFASLMDADAVDLGTFKVA